MTETTVKIAKLNGNRYEISVESEYGVLKCLSVPSSTGIRPPVDMAKREADTTQLASTRARASAEVLNRAQSKSAISPRNAETRRTSRSAA